MTRPSFAHTPECTGSHTVRNAPAGDSQMFNVGWSCVCGATRARDAWNAAVDACVATLANRPRDTEVALFASNRSNAVGLALEVIRMQLNELKVTDG